MTTHLQPDILECKVKWALGSSTMIKTSEDDEIPAVQFKILEDDPVKVLDSICQQIWNSAVAIGQEKISFYSSPKEGQCQKMFKLPHSCIHFAC